MPSKNAYKQAKYCNMTYNILYQKSRFPIAQFTVFIKLLKTPSPPLSSFLWPHFLWRL